MRATEHVKLVNVDGHNTAQFSVTVTSILGETGILWISGGL